MANDHCIENNEQWDIPEVPECFHGEITRRDAEERLQRFSISNSYLLRLSLSERENGKISVSYVLSFFTSKSICLHFKLVPRLHSFQLGGRLFQCLKCILSRYYQNSIVPGEFLRTPIPPCSPPVEYYAQRVKAVRKYEPVSNMRLGCKPEDEFLVVEDESDPDWMLVTSVQTRQSGYLPKFCLEKVYPDLIDRLCFFHSDSTADEQQELLIKNGPFSYLLRLCDSDPGFYTLLLYDGTRILKYKLALIVMWWFVNNNANASGDITTIPTSEVSSEINVQQETGDGVPTTNQIQKLSAGSGVLSKGKLYESETKIHYNNHWYVSVEEVVAAIETQFNQNEVTQTKSCDQRIDFHPVERGPKVTPSADSIYMAMSFNRRPPSPRAVLEVHGELALWLPSRKKWKHIYAMVDREHSILTLLDGEKRKPERLDLTRCDYFPVHPMMFDKSCCFGLLLSGTSMADSKEDYIFSVESPNSVSCGGGSSGAHVGGGVNSVSYCGSQSTSHLSTTTTTASSSSSSASSARIPISSTGNSHTVNSSSSSGGGGIVDLDPQAYAGRPLDSIPTTGPAEFSSSTVRPYENIRSTGDACNPNWHRLGTCLKNNGRPTSLELAYTRWVKALSFHCRNTSNDSAIDVDPERRRNEVRCFRTLEVKLSNAKLVALAPTARREGIMYSVYIDGLEIARAYSASLEQVITFEEFPYGYKKIEVTSREDKKKKSQLLAEMDLAQRSTTSNIPSSSSGAYYSPSASGSVCLGCPTSKMTTSSSGSSSSSIVAVKVGLLHSGGSFDSSEPPPLIRPPSSFAKTSLVPICSIRESISPQVTLTYRELYVLPFQYYKQLRMVMVSHLATELVPVCMHMWEILPSSDQDHFVSSLLRACIESNTHLQLIVDLLKTEIPTDNQMSKGAHFRGNSVGCYLLDYYMNMVCSEWRQKCYRRVFEEAAKGQSVAPAASTTPMPTTFSRGVKFTTGGCPNTSASSASEVVSDGSSSSSSGIPIISGHSSSDIFRSSVSASMDSATSIYLMSQQSTVTTAASTNLLLQQPHPSLSTFVNTPSTPTTALNALGNCGVARTSVVGSGSSGGGGHSEWYRTLVEMLIDDFLKYASEFPLQIRWIYAELQKCPPLQSTNEVLCNLVFLRGLVPNFILGLEAPTSMTSPSATTPPDVSVYDSKSCLVTVAKILISLINPKPSTAYTSENTLPPDVILAYRTNLVDKFAPQVMSPLSLEELNQLERLKIDEAMRVGSLSMSRVLAQLASYFQMALLPELANQSSTLLNRSTFAAKSPPQANLLKECLRDLSRITPSPSSSSSCGPHPQQQTQPRFRGDGNQFFVPSVMAPAGAGVGVSNPPTSLSDITSSASARLRGLHIFHT